MAEDINITVTFNDKASKNIKKTEKAVKDLSKTTKQAGKQTTDTFNIIKGVVGGAAVIGAFRSATNSAKALFRTFVTDGVKAAQVQENAINQLNTALALTGEFSQEASQDFQDFASSLQSVTTVGDEVILQQAALAKSFGLTNDQAKDLVTSAIDLSAATGISLDSAVRNLGKTFGGLTGELGEVVPALKNLTKEELEAGKAVDFVLKRFGGSGQAAAKTFAGAISQAGNTFGDLTEEIGNTIVKNGAFIAVINEFSKQTKEASGGVRSLSGDIKNLLANAFILAAKAAVLFLAVIDNLKIAIGAVVVVIDGFLKGIQALGIILTALLGKSIKQIKAELIGLSSQFKQNASDLTSSSKAVETLAVKIARLGQVAEGNIGTTNNLNDQYKKLSDNSNLAADGVTKLTDAQKAQIELAKQLATEGASQGEQTTLEVLRGQLELEEITREEFRARESQFLLNKLQEEQNAIKVAEDEKKLTQEQSQTARQQSFNKFLIGNQKARKADVDDAKRKEAEKAANLKSSLGTIAGLQSSSNKELFAIGKAAAIANAIVDAKAAVVKAFGQGGFFGFALATAVSIATAANIASIASAQPPKLASGLEEVPQGFNNDTFPAFLQSGEGVVRRETNSRFERIADQNETLLPLIANGLANISAKLDNVGAQFSVNANVDGLFEVIRDGQDSGRVLG